MTTHWSEALARLDACEDARNYAATQPDLATAWAQCERADWLLWLAARLGLREKTRPALFAVADKAVREYAPRSMDAIADGCGERTARGLRERAETLRALPEIVDEETAWYGNAWARTAYADAADDAADAADAAAAAAAYADAADDADDAADAAAYAAAYAAAAADAAAAARMTALREMADLVRARLPFALVAAALARKIGNPPPREAENERV